MKSLITTLLTIGLVAPVGAYAFDMDAIIEAAKNGNGTYVETNSSVSTGGQRAGSGESVQTGDAHASSHTEIHANDDGGEVKVKIETSKNGETKTEEYSQPIEKGKGVDVRVNASVTDDESKTEVTVDGDKKETNESHTSSATAAFETTISFFSEKIPNVFKRVFSFLWRF